MKKMKTMIGFGSGKKAKAEPLVESGDPVDAAPEEEEEAPKVVRAKTIVGGKKLTGYPTLQELEEQGKDSLGREIKQGKGILVTIRSASNLRNADGNGEGLAGPFAVCEINRREKGRLKTPPISNTLDPVWDWKKQMLYFSKGESLNFRIYNQDFKDLLGTCQLAFDMYWPDGFSGSLPLGISSTLGSDQPAPEIQVEVKILGPPKSETYMHDALMNKMGKNVAEKVLPKETVVFEFKEPPLHQRFGYLPDRGLAVTVICATNLGNRDRDVEGDLSDPFVVVEIKDRRDSSFRTPVIMNTLNPIWNYEGQLYNYQKGDRMKFLIWDKDFARKAGGNLDMLGRCELEYEDYFNGVEGRMMIPSGIGKEPGWLTVRVKVLGPPDDPEKRDAKIKGNQVEPEARETKHIFLEYLKHRRGTSFRGWRLDVDRRQTNRVNYTDMMASCKSLGLSITEARRIWHAYRPAGKTAVPLTFDEFDPEEWEHLNNFLETLWQELNFDLDLAWSILDPTGNGFITFEEFNIAMDRIGFTGDPSLVFQGLDTAGQGRVWKDELECLRLLSPESRPHPELSVEIQELTGWFKDKYRGDASRLIWDLGCKDGNEYTQISVKRLAEKLQSLGFTGDVLHTSMTISRCNPSMEFHDIVAVLGRAADPVRKPASFAERKWGYKAAERGTGANKPDWYGTVFDPVRFNTKLGERERHYFCKPFDRPVRDAMFRELERNKGFKVMTEGAKGQVLTRQEYRARGGQDVGGMRPMIQSDISRVNKAIERWNLSVGGSVASPFTSEGAKAAVTAQQVTKEVEDIKAPTPLTSSTPAFKRALSRVNSMKNSAEENGSKGQRLKVTLLGCIGLSDTTTDHESRIPYASCRIRDRDETEFCKEVHRETGEYEKNYQNYGVLPNFTLDDVIEFIVLEEEQLDRDDDDEVFELGSAELLGSVVLQEGRKSFEERLQLTHEDEPCKGCFLLVKVEILEPGEQVVVPADDGRFTGRSVMTNAPSLFAATDMSTKSVMSSTSKRSTKKYDYGGKGHIEKSMTNIATESPPGPTD